MDTQQPVNTAKSETERTNFVGRVQEQRQFRVVLQGLLEHHRRWRNLSDSQGAGFDPDQAPGDGSYTRILLLHGIGGIGKSWLVRRCLTLAEAVELDPPVLTLYDDLSLGAPVLEPTDLLNRIVHQLVRAGFDTVLAPFRQAQLDAPIIAGRVAHYRGEHRQTWETLIQSAATLLAGVNTPAAPDLSGADSAPVLAKANDLLLDHMQQAGRLTPAEVNLLLDPPAARAALLVAGLKQIAAHRPLLISLDNLEVIVPLEPFIRDHLVLPTTHAPILWLLSGRHNLADERVVEIDGRERVHKGYRDLLGENPPLVWDMSTFGDADLREYLDEEALRRLAPLTIDDNLIAAVKATSSGVPLVVEMVADALFTLERDEFLQNFVLDDKTLLPVGRLEQITARFLRYCLTREDDLARVQGMALLRRGADEQALRAVWALLPQQQVSPLLHGLRMRYAFVQPDGLHDAVYDFVRRQLHSLTAQRGIGDRLARRAETHYRGPMAKSRRTRRGPRPACRRW